jgi:hypothetical protein
VQSTACTLSVPRLQVTDQETKLNHTKEKADADIQRKCPVQSLSADSQGHTLDRVSEGADCCLLPGCAQVLVIDGDGHAGNLV